MKETISTSYLAAVGLIATSCYSNGSNQPHHRYCWDRSIVFPCGITVVVVVQCSYEPYIFSHLVATSSAESNRCSPPSGSVCWQWHCPHLLLSAELQHCCFWAPAVQQSISFSCPPGAQQQTHSSGVWHTSDGTDEQTDAQPLHRPCSVDYASSVSSVVSIIVRSQEGEGHVRTFAERTWLSSDAPQASRAGEESTDHRPAAAARPLRLLRTGASVSEVQVRDCDEREDADETWTRSRCRRSSGSQECSQDEGADSDLQRNVLAK